MSSEKDSRFLAQVNSLIQPPRVPKKGPHPLQTTAVPAHHKPNSPTEPHPSIAHELPRNVQELLHGYFEKHQTIQVPSEIYYQQVGRVFSTVDGKPAIYVAYPTGEHVKVHAYILPQMRETKSSERLLVAEGRPFDAPIVLARTKPHSNTYRAWQGASDDPLGPPVVQRQIIDSGRSKTKRRRSTSAAVQADECRPVLGKRRTFGEDQNHFGERDLGLDRTAHTHLSTDPAMVSQTALASNPNIESPIGNKHPSTAAGLEAPLDPLPNLPDVALLPRVEGQALTTVNKEPDINPGSTLRPTQNQRLLTTLNFMPHVAGQTRSRDLLTCGSYDALLRNAVAGDVFPASECVHVLSATINDQQARITVADEVDFDILLRAIEADDCWKEVGGLCQVTIERYKPKQLFKVEHGEEEGQYMASP